mmetsp:Transcript_13864/g.35384  ORF Transcript_13864/g.35384 Transcript_13864/m.35384 type:complete len:813 (-) Transcript_13864:57-2495(-)|eukprot:CAMPEP_0177664464 /NCGR_PEP_ID=MMETSP0447-20121125/20508_1 /TAXON_ID=0 /ORGANISM="Stygamoeba regulata, Strain BSH-02190019" /LENGTH=812 /DNA_ID=CAMNT_0019170439 /DNA_START=40 /DNA_END=2478 /DNA_ORIENTATION=+
MHRKVKEKDVRAVRALLETTPDSVNAPERFRRQTPLHFAAAEGSEELVCMLLQHGADATLTDSHGHTPMHLALAGGHVDVAHLLVTHGADLSFKVPTDRSTLLHHLARIPALPAAKDQLALYFRLLRRTLGVVDVNAEDARGETALHQACSLERASLATFLLDRGADPNSTTLCGDTPLHYAARRGSAALIMLLLERGANVHARSEKGDAEDVAVACKHDEAARLLAGAKAKGHSNGAAERLPVQSTAHGPHHLAPSVLRLGHLRGLLARSLVPPAGTVHSCMDAAHPPPAAVSAHLLCTFVSLHSPCGAVLYVSEAAPNTLNPGWRAPCLPPHAQSLSTCTLVVWALPQVRPHARTPCSSCSAVTLSPCVDHYHALPEQGALATALARHWDAPMPATPATPPAPHAPVVLLCRPVHMARLRFVAHLPSRAVAPTPTALTPPALTLASLNELPANTLLLELQDGYYVQRDATDELDPPLPLHMLTSARSKDAPVPSCGLDMICRMINSRMRKRQFEAERDRRQERLREALVGCAATVARVDRVNRLRMSVRRLQGHVLDERARLVELTAAHTQLHREELTRARALRDTLEGTVAMRGQLQVVLVDIERETHSLEGQLRLLEALKAQLMQQLGGVFTIRRAGGQGGARHDTINSVPLPHSDAYAGADEEDIATALGWVGLAVCMAACILDIPLLYAITPMESRTTIEDLHKEPASKYPLYPRGSDYRRFHHAVLLLNLNIHQLLGAQGLTPLELTHTLPNLDLLLSQGVVHHAPQHFSYSDWKVKKEFATVGRVQEDDNDRDASHSFIELQEL